MSVSTTAYGANGARVESRAGRRRKVPLRPPLCNLKTSPENGRCPQTLSSPGLGGKDASAARSVPCSAPGAGAMSSKAVSLGGSLAFPKVMIADFNHYFVY